MDSIARLSLVLEKSSSSLCCINAGSGSQVIRSRLALLIRLVLMMCPGQKAPYLRNMANGKIVVIFFRINR
ncbi:BnaAnng07470D [Brassica napus]|uniref:BnaAnng07470D protein n=1 Tax=Brassica napus TaxID=3708 RepID=A0A078I0W1_BRANA|nr:BnaAnng07470D [Brassica napus]